MSIKFKQCGKCKKVFQSMGVNDNWCTACCRAITDAKWQEMERKNAPKENEVVEVLSIDKLVLQEKINVLKEVYEINSWEPDQVETFKTKISELTEQLNSIIKSKLKKK